MVCEGEEVIDYQEFIKSKALTGKALGFDPIELSAHLFPFQRDIVQWACRLGRAAIFADTGLGKTAMQVEWARQVGKHTSGNVLILAPLCVAHQTVAEGRKFCASINYCRDQSNVVPGINITNY